MTENDLFTVVDPDTGERLDHYEWSGWLWCENEREAFDWQTGEVECPHCGDVFGADRPSPEDEC